jgi:glucose/mannose-6-phosphate isomerase
MITAEKISQLDRSNMFPLVTGFPEQLRKAWAIASEASIPKARVPIKNIVTTGMGGSAMGGDLLGNQFVQELEIPVYVNRGYSLPHFVDSNTLVLACSYSGDTEETLQALESVSDRKPQVICISSNGTLEKIANKKGYPLIKVPGGQPPRSALGYLFISMLVSMQKIGLLSDQKEAFEEALTLMTRMSEELADYTKKGNPAVTLAERLVGKTPIIYGSTEPNEALATRWRNQFSENSKILAYGNLIPEMNHNEIVGWADPTAILDKVHVIFLRDDNNSSRIQLRTETTKEILAKHKIPVTEWSAQGRSRLCRTFSLLLPADFVSFYLAILNDADPTAIENIVYLKQKLATLK